MPAIPGIPIPFLGVEREILLARRWKFCDEILFLFPSASGVGEDEEAPVGSGVDTRGGVAVVSNVMAVGSRICVCEALLIERESSDVGNAKGAVSGDVGKATGAEPTDELGNAVGCGSSEPDEGKETGASKSLAGMEGATLSALTLAAGLIEGAWTDGARIETVTARGES
jgi:hypothetical protein